MIYVKKSLKTILIALALFIACGMVLPITALASSGSGNTIPSTRQVERLVDDADLLDSEEEAELLDMLDSYSEEVQMDICILTVSERDTYSIEAFADDYYDYNGIGYGSDRSGILLVLSMDDRSYALSTCGAAIEAFTDSTQEDMMDPVLEELSYNDYYYAFKKFATSSRSIALSYNNSFIGDSNLRKSDLIMYLVILVAALIIPLVPLSANIMSLNNIAFQKGADKYKQGKLALSTNQDIYLSHHVKRVAIPKESRSGGGGSSTHISSSGTTHGGSHGHF